MDSSRHDIQALRASLRSHIQHLLQHMFPAGQKRGHTFVVGDVIGNAGDSLVVECEGQSCGLWKDFATDEGGDLIDLWAARHGLDVGRQFPEIVEQLQAWLGHGAKNAVLPARSTQHWDYLDPEGRLIARAVREDTAQGKRYRPWDAIEHRWGMPTPRPLYRLPDLKHADMVIVVEGEKCADALAKLGCVATTAMGGANAPFDKTDWQPLAGKAIVLWPDHDVPGKQYAQKLIDRLPEIGLKTLKRVVIPADKPAKWDAADAVADGTDVANVIRLAIPVEQTHQETLQQSNQQDLNAWRAIDRFKGEPSSRQWLVTGVFPLAQASLLAASGGISKSFLLLALARLVATDVTELELLGNIRLFGGEIATHGVAVYLTAEDDAIELHNRLRALGDIPERLYVMPLPDAGGAQAYFAPDPGTKGPTTTPAWESLVAQMVAFENQIALVVFDPLQPLCALDLNVPENAQFVCSRLSTLAAKTGATVIVSHHFAKREVHTPEQAREAIRGTGGLVDGVRSVYALWQAREDEAKTIAKQLELPYQRSSVIRGGVVKANGKANLQVVTFVRDECGLLFDRTADLQRVNNGTEHLLRLLTLAIAQAAANGKPYTKTGVNGVYGRRFEMQKPLHTIGKHSLANMVDKLLASGQIVQAMADKSKSVKWLDVPSGAVAQGQANFTAGFIQPRLALGSRS